MDSSLHKSINKLNSSSPPTVSMDRRSIELSEEDFYPPFDNRTYCSGVKNIYKGDNFYDYLKEFYQYCDEEQIFDS